jgi:acyl-CoA thioester hydrolase
MSALVHSYPFTVLESHLDTFGHMNHATYLVVLEEARWDLLTGRGFGLEKVMESGISPVVLEVNIKFIKELRLRRKFVIETQLASFDRTVFKVRQEIKDAEDKVYCTAELTFALFDIEKRRIIAPTPDWLKALGVES